MNTQIHSTQFIGGALFVTASVSHVGAKTIDPSVVAAELQNKTKNALYALAGSFNVIEHAPRRTLIQGFMIPAKESVPFTEHTKGFHSLSSSLYQDESEHLWNLQRTEHGNYLVRANNIEDPAEIMELMQACCSTIQRGSDQNFFQAVASSANAREDIAASDYVQYQHEGAMHFGFALAGVEHEDIENAIAVVNPSADRLDIIAHEQIVGNAEFGYAIAGATFDPLDDFASLSGATNDTLVEYYRKVYGFNPEYFSKLEAIIQGHRFM